MGQRAAWVGMNLNDLANLGQIIGAVAVVVSLIYVALQIRQNTNAIRSAAAQTVHEHFASWYRLVAADPDLSQIVVNGYARLFITLGNAESAVHRYLHGVCLLLTECVSQMAREIARPATVDGVGACHHEPCVRAGGKAFWKDRGYMFGEEFRHYVEDDLMKRTPHPDAKPMGAFPVGQRSE